MIKNVLVCRIRNNNKNGWSDWSLPSTPVTLFGDQLAKQRGDHSTGTYWSKAAAKIMKVFSGGRRSDLLHKHRYCHVH